MKEKDVSKTQFILKEKLRSTILKKLDSIRDKITFEKGSDNSAYLQMLIMVSEDLDDVLLNWEYDSISPNLSFQDDLDDIDDEDY
jgi:hypothetical protein